MLSGLLSPRVTHRLARKACTFGFVLGIVVIFSFLDACTTSQKMAGSLTLLSGVPFYRQEAYECGPAALATVITYWHTKTGVGSVVTPEEIVAEIFSPSARGVLGLDLQLFAKKRGFQTQTSNGSLDEIRKQIDRGIPPIILVDYGFSFYQRNHFIVVTGYAANGVLANTGSAENEFIGEEELLRIWKKTGYWMLVVKP
ncbi:MAG: C39 family peptidase [candidate division WOR-3 bacterium]